MADEIADSHSATLFVSGRAREIALVQEKRHRAFAYAGLIPAALAAIKATLAWGWLGTAGMVSIGVITLVIVMATRKLSAARLRTAFADPAAFGVVFEPPDPGDYKRFGGNQWRRRSFRALLVIHRDRLYIRPDELGQLNGWQELSLPVAAIRRIVVSRHPGLRPGAILFVELEGEKVIQFRLLDRGKDLIPALYAAGISTTEGLWARPL